MARASPKAICMVVEVVGARPLGQASSALGRTSATSAARASALSRSAVMAISGRPKRLACWTTSRSSGVSPDHDSASTTSPSATMPRSPWLASAGCRKKAGWPVEASVAAILRAT